jgi:uncharacterized beta-barrel protein YwiB (DUF1934 family)
MKKINIDFSIKSTEASNSFVTVGEFKNNRIKFFDNEENANYIIFQNDIVEYYKKGNTDMKYKFDLLNTTKGEYTLSNFKFIFDIKTIKLVVEKNQVRIGFELYQDGDFVNKTDIHIKYTFIKEEQ